MSLADEVLQHLLRHLKVGDNAVLHRADRNNVARCAAKHLLCVAAYGLDLIRDLVDRNDRRFRDDDAATLCVNERIGRAEIDRQDRWKIN